MITCNDNVNKLTYRNMYITSCLNEKFLRNGREVICEANKWRCKKCASLTRPCNSFRTSRTSRTQELVAGSILTVSFSMECRYQKMT